MHFKGTFAATLLLICFPLSAENLQLNSGDRQILLMELYTSEGCSSCPPAEHYLNNYIDKPELWKSIIPMAFHVDYWDQLGWQDRYASPKYSERQRAYAVLQRNRTVYTPAFFVNGHSWRPGFFYKSMPQNEAALVGNLAITLQQQNLVASFTPLQPIPEGYTLNIALLGMGLNNRITAGENEGRLARHEFVVLGTGRSLKPGSQWLMQLPKINTRIKKEKIKRYAIAAWVTRHNKPFPVQAVAGYIPSAFINN